MAKIQFQNSNRVAVALMRETSTEMFNDVKRLSSALDELKDNPDNQAVKERIKGLIPILRGHLNGLENWAETLK